MASPRRSRVRRTRRFMRGWLGLAVGDIGGLRVRGRRRARARRLTGRAPPASVPPMNEQRMGGGALISAALGLIVTMGLHPTGHDLFEPGRYEAMARLAVAVHALAIATLPLSFLGALVLTRRLSVPLGLGALVVYGIATLAGVVAAASGGFVAPELAGAALAAEPAARDGWNQLLEYNHMLNQAFASILVVGSSAAIALWSLEIVKSGALARWVGVYGLGTGLLAVLAHLSGHLRLDVHGFGLVVLVQSVWFVSVGVLLWRAAAGRAP